MTFTRVAGDLRGLRKKATSGDAAALERLAAECAGPRFDVASLDLAAGLFARRLPGQWRFRAPEALRVDHGEAVALDGSLGWVHGTGSGYLTNEDGRSFDLTIGPGLLRLSAFDAARRDRTAVREEARILVNSEQNLQRARRSVTPHVGLVDRWEPPSPSRTIWEWSARSRGRLRQAFASVDWTQAQVPGEPLGMVTVTYPGDWLAVAPSGRVVKGHLRALRARLERLTGRTVRGAWKMEFQERGAPHFHILMAVPALGTKVLEDGRTEPFEAWLSRVWANIVKADDVHCRRCGLGRLCPVDERVGCRNRSKVHRALAGPLCRCYETRDTEYTRHLSAGTGVDFNSTGRMTDPKRLSTYFLKHSTKDSGNKEYQNQVPAEWLVDDQGEMTPESGPGRFWGFWGMDVETRTVNLDYRDFQNAKRILRKVAAGRSRRIDWERARHAGWSPADLIGRPVRKPRTLRSASLTGGYVIVNDGVRTAETLARVLPTLRPESASATGKPDPARLALIGHLACGLVCRH